MANERIFKFVGSVLTLLPARDSTRRYKYTAHPTNPIELIYLEFTDLEETARSTEESTAGTLPFTGFGKVSASRTNQNIASAAPTVVQFDTELFDFGNYHDPAASNDRFTVPILQAGDYSINVSVVFTESSAGAGGTPNVGDRGVMIRVNGNNIVSDRRRASTTGDTEVPINTDITLNEGDIVRVGVLQNCGGTLNITSKFRMRRL